MTHCDAIDPRAMSVERSYWPTLQCEAPLTWWPSQRLDAEPLICARPAGHDGPCRPYPGRCWRARGHSGPHEYFPEQPPDEEVPF